MPKPTKPRPSRASGHRVAIDHLALMGMRRPDTEPRDWARFAFLLVVSEVNPRVLQDLADANDVAKWAAHWPALNTPWVMPYALSTLQSWRLFAPGYRGRAWFDHGDGAGYLVSEAPIGKTGTAAYRSPDHWRWLARVLVGGATYYGLAKELDTDARKIQRACTRTAKELELPLPHRLRVSTQTPAR